MEAIRTVYVANAKTNKVDAWFCTGEITANYNGKKEKICFLTRNRKNTALPKRCVFETEEAARAVLNRK